MVRSRDCGKLTGPSDAEPLDLANFSARRWHSLFKRELCVVHLLKYSFRLAPQPEINAPRD
jgi:hypothetical protein